MANTIEYILKLRDQFSQSLKGANDRLKGIEMQSKKTSGAFAGLGSKIAQIGAAVGAVSLANKIIETTSAFETLQTSIEFASGSTDESQKNMAFLRETSNKLKLDVLSTADAFKQLLGSTMGTALQGDKTRQIFESVATASRVMGLSADDTKGAIIALSQMVSKGKVSAEELRGQLGERLPGAFQIASRAMGITTQQLDKMLQNGEVLSEDFLPKFAVELQKTFGGGVAKATNTLGASLTQLKSKFSEIMVQIGTAFLPIINKVLNAFGQLTEKISTFFSGNKFGSSILSFFEMLTPYINDVKDLINAIWDRLSSLDIEQQFSRLLGVFVTLWDIIKKIVTSTIFQKLLDFAMFLVKVINEILVRVLGIFGAIGSAIADVINMDFTGIFKRAGDAYKKIVEGVKLPVAEQKKEQNSMLSKVNETATKVQKVIPDKTKTSVDSKIGGVQGTSPKVFNINIGKLVELVEVHSATLKESSIEIEQQLTKVLINALNNAQTAID